MNVGKKIERQNARSLLAQAIAPDAAPLDVARSVDVAFAHLLVSLGRWVGDESARVLLARAVDETRPQRAWLAGIRVTLGEGRCFVGLDERVEALAPTELAETMEELLVVLIELLAKFIGNDLALRIVIRGWPSGPPAAKEGESR
ncbi:MAG: hypothetical protein Q8P18_06210 [Pseudomonadota bacterium]|nr:hypothetical protein [Pseudomonadota bacterium]